MLLLAGGILLLGLSWSYGVLGRASCWLGSQKTVAEESGTVLSNDVKEEWILVILPSLANGLVVFAGAKTGLSSARTRPWGGSPNHHGRVRRGVGDDTVSSDHIQATHFSSA